MQRRRYISLLCGLALAPASQLYSGRAVAIPAEPGPVETSAESVQPDSVPQATVTAETSPQSPPANAGFATNMPCLSAVFDDTVSDDSLADIQCDESSFSTQRLSVQFGRRFETGAGVLGKTDGIRFDYRLKNGITLNGVAGYRAVAENDTFNTGRQVFGLSADSGRIAEAWNLNAYVMEQQDDDRADRTTVGGSARYLQENNTVLFFFDHETAQATGRAFMATGAWKLPHRTTLSATFDVRTSPVHSLQKKYLKNTMKAGSDWTWLLPVERIAHFTRDNDTEVTTLGFGLTHDFSRQLKLSGDIAILEIGDEPASAASDATAVSPSEYFYHIKLSGRDWMIPGHRGNLDLRHSITASARSSSATLKTRYAFNRRWHFSPSLSTDFHDYTQDNSARWITSPALKMEYRWKEQYGFQIEAGSKWTRSEDTGAKKLDSSYFVSMAYQLSF